MKTISLLFIGVIAFLACNRKNVETRTIFFSKEYSRTDDSLYVGYIGDFCVVGDTVYMTDNYNSIVYKLLPNHKLFNIFPYQKGKGPGELLGPSGIEIYKDTIFIETSGSKINYYTKELSYLGYYKLKRRHYGDTFIFDNKGNIHYQIHSKSAALIRENRFTKEIFKYGKPVIHKGKINVYRSMYLLTNNNGKNIIAVRETLPEIVFFDFNGNPLKKINISNLPCLRNTLIAIEEWDRKNKSVTSYSVLFRHALIKRGFLYLSYYDHSTNTSNYILKFKIENLDLRFVEKIILQTNDKYTSFSSFGITNDNRLITFDNINKKLIEFQIDAL